jgi:hypothetical protein
MRKKTKKVEDKAFAPGELETDERDGRMQESRQDDGDPAEALIPGPSPVLEEHSTGEGIGSVTIKMHRGRAWTLGAPVARVFGQANLAGFLRDNTPSARVLQSGETVTLDAETARTICEAGYADVV